jgi:hypothetical protein
MVNPTVERISLGVLIASLSIEGLLLLFSGWWLPEVSLSLRLVGIFWLLVCIMTVFINRKPYMQIASVWIWFLTLIWAWWSATEERSLVWFLFQNMFPLIALVSSHFKALPWNTSGRMAGISRSKFQQ